MDNSRDDIRRQLRARRRALTPWERRRLSLELGRRLLTLPLFRRSRHIAFYLPNDGEVDLTLLIARARRMGKRCYLPVLSPGFHQRLWFAVYRPGCRMGVNRFGIAEPVIRWRDARPARSLDLILAPLVAFDETGNRLGMGGGFYDRTLAFLDSRDRWRKPRLLGTAFEFQRVGRLPHAPWDVPLDGVVTDQGSYGAG